VTTSLVSAPDGINTTTHSLVRTQPNIIVHTDAKSLQALTEVLREFLDIFCSAYMDDMLIWSNSDYLDHMAKVNQVLAKLKAAGLKVNLAKCAFAVKEVKYLDFIISAGEGIKVDPEMVAAIKEWESPVNVQGVRSFLGFANFYRDFIDNFSEIATPLNKLTRKGLPLFGIKNTKACSKY
jgi:hypothetical protein